MFIDYIPKSSLFNINWIELVKAKETVTHLGKDLQAGLIYPVPSKRFFVLQTQGKFNASDIEIINLNGRNVDSISSQLRNQRTSNMIFFHEADI